MLRCLGRLGCLVLIAVLAAGAYLTRDQWLPGRAPEPADALDTALTAGAAREGEWAPLSDDGAARARRAVTALGAPSGPAYITIAPGDLASYVFSEIARQLPPSASDIQATAIGDRLYVRASVELSELGGADVLGPLGAMLGTRETVQFGGTLDVIRPGLAQFRVRELKLRELSVPSPLVPRLLERLVRVTRPGGVAADALPLEIPDHVGDVRVSGGRVTVYKRIG